MAHVRHHAGPNNTSPAVDDIISVVHPGNAVELPTIISHGQGALGTESPREPNAPNPRIQFNRTSIYERRLPGGSYINAHIQRHQHGFVESSVLGQRIEHVDFVAVDFVLHSHDPSKHRFKSAEIRMSVKQGQITPEMLSERILLQDPKFLMHAPHLLYGAGSPDNMQWTFNRAGSRTTFEAPVIANVGPSGTGSRTKKHNDMVQIQGSVRTLKSPYGSRFDVEGGEVVWTLQENKKQKSGLPREFTFAVLIQKGSLLSPVDFRVDIEPKMQTWFGAYPRAWLNQFKYEGVHKNSIEFKYAIGQSFQPIVSGYGFNFGSMIGTLDDFVQMPGLCSTRGRNIDPQSHAKRTFTIEHIFENDPQDPHLTDDDEVRISTPASSHFGIAVSTNAPTIHTPVSEALSHAHTETTISQPHTEADTNESLPIFDGGRDEFLTSTPTMSERLVQTIPRVRPRTLRRTRRSFSLNELWRRHGARTNGVRQTGMPAVGPEHFIDDEELGLAFAPTSSEEERLITTSNHSVSTEDHDDDDDDDDWLVDARQL